jgi:hypothetical protein
MMPGAFSAFLTALATFCAVLIIAAAPSGDSSKMFSAGSFGITSVCPSAWGMTSMKASVWLSS